MKVSELLKLLKKNNCLNYIIYYKGERNMAKYVYPAIFTPEGKGLFSVEFPDLEGCYTSGDNLQDALMKKLIK